MASELSILQGSAPYYYHVLPSDLSRGQSYQMALPGGGTQSKTFADLRAVNDTIALLRQQIDMDNAAAGGEIPVNFARMTRR